MDNKNDLKLYFMKNLDQVSDPKEREVLSKDTTIASVSSTIDDGFTPVDINEPMVVFSVLKKLPTTNESDIDAQSTTKEENIKDENFLYLLNMYFIFFMP